MMGEAPKLTMEESRRFVARVLARVAGRVPVIAGVSAPGFAQMRALSDTLMQDGVSGVMVAPPGHLRADNEIFNYYATVAETLGDTPFVLQDYPLSTGVRITPEVIGHIVDAIPTCVMLKHEDWPGLSKISALRHASDKGQRRISILTGNGGLFLPEELDRGADGAMTGFAYPEMMVDVCHAFKDGDKNHAHDLFDAYLPLVRYEQQPGLGLAVRKHTLARRRAIASPALRRPGPSLSEAAMAEIDYLVVRQDRRLAEIE